jgi:two-component system response regulator FixJ
MNRVPLIAIIDDDADLRQALRMLLTSKGFEARPYASAQGFLDCSEPDKFDCIITDVRMPDMTGVELLLKMKQTGLTVPVIVITAYADVPLAIQVMKEGAVDLLEKPFNDEMLLNAVKAAFSFGTGDRGRDAEIRSIRSRLSTLTARENEVLSGLLGGQLNKVIAHNLGIGMRTVETHRAAIMEKMQAENLSELLRMYLIADLDRNRT